MLIENSSWLKDGKRITILKDNKLNFQGTVYPYTLTDGHIQILEWGDNSREIVENGKLCGWEEELPLFNRYHPEEWDRFLHMFFPHQYQGDNIQKGEMKTDIWKLWKTHYLNENQSSLKSPRDRTALKLSRSPSISPLSSPTHSPGNSPRGSVKMSPLRFKSEGSNKKKDEWTSSPELSRYLKK